MGRRLKARLRRWLFEHGYVLVALHDFFVKRAFRREVLAVYSGVQRHQQDRLAGTALSFVRRHAHMIEKGLSMRPRRSTFGTAYVTELVDAIGTCSAAGLFDQATSRWIDDVMTMYFDVTRDGRSAVIDKARTAFEELTLESPVTGFHGPAPIGTWSDSVDIADLEKLAHQRVSVRWFDERPVSRDVVDRAIDVGIQAPSACNRLPYRFIILDEPAAAREVAELPGGTAGYALNIHSVVAVVGDLSSYAHSRDRHLIYIDASLAVMGFLLALQAQGVSTCCINWPDLSGPDSDIAEILKLAPYERTVMLIAYGYGDASGVAPGSAKKDLSEIRTFVTEERPRMENRL